MSREHRVNLLKMVPGLLISAFFLWWTFRGFDMADLETVRFVAPVWIIGIVAFTLAGYTMRCVRAWWMLRSVKARFSACSRIFLTSLAANNILPLRIGDVMRVFTYASDVNATPSMVLSTVILEKLLDVFSLATLFVITMHGGRAMSSKLRGGAEIGLAISAACLLVLVFGAHTLQEPVRRIAAKSSNRFVKKIEQWLLLAMECIEKIGVGGTLLLVLFSFIAWSFEGLIYVSAANLVALRTDAIGPWQAVSQANLSFLIPSSPGGIGPFEWACKDALVRHGSPPAAAGLFGLLIHAWLFVVITGVGGAMFLMHRLHRARRLPLKEELDTLPAQLPYEEIRD
ncbi:MAG TPA: lysylphosphatidylglycerol synthase transmembrane domain-containing protein [Candidatus Aquilonibacter sp.]|nr:lysylphosphatidylglycerol synthase transmembrane domain-containing protein [Candidatus Aquilonibacter sp.]